MTATGSMPEPLQRPPSPAALFKACNWLALQGFGGVLPVAQRELVERLRWLSHEDFLQTLSLAQVLPGPNVINLVLMIGDRFFGWRGALAAMAGMLAAPLVAVLALALLAAHLQDLPAVTGALRGMGVVAAGLVLSTAVKLAAGLRRNPLGPWASALFVAASALAVGWLRWPLVAVVLGLGLLASALAWTRIKP